MLQSKKKMTLTTVLIFGWSAAVVSADVVLKQIHVITRHGARTPLAKQANNLAEEAGSRLTPLGEKQLYELGTWLRQTYNQGGFLEYYDPATDRLEASNTDRALSSANSLSMGLFPLSAQRVGDGGTELFTSMLPQAPNIPVYSRQERNDIYLRAFQICPTFHEKLETLYTSNSWTLLEGNSKVLLKKLASVFPPNEQQKREWPMDGTEYVLPLKEIWTYYDLVNVARTECNPDPNAPSCTSLERPDAGSAFSEDEFQEMQRIMASEELMKYGIGTAGNLLGSNLLWEILARATADHGGRFFLYSAHSATLLGFLSTVRDFPIQEQFPDYGSAIIVEIHEDVDKNFYTIRFLYKPRFATQAYYMPMKDTDACGDTHKTNINNVTVGEDLDHCQLSSFLLWASSNTHFTPTSWCQACGNGEADVCMETKLNGTSIGQSVKELASVMKDNGFEPWVVAATFFGGFFAGMLIYAFFQCLCC